MEIINTDSGYDAKLQSEYQSVTVKHNGHIFDISKDRFGVHVMLDNRPCKHYPSELDVIVVRITNTE